MRLFFKAILLIFLFSRSIMANDIFVNQPTLVVDSGAHTGAIWDLIVTPDNKHVISASTDKTIRIWDVKTKLEVRKILGQIGDGNYGGINAIALSSDSRWLAVGGWTDEQCMGKCGNIRIYDFYSGEILQLLESHSNTVLDLSFSDDNKYLVSGSTDKTVKVWSTGDDFNLYQTLSKHIGYVYAVKTLPGGNIISAGEDGQVILWKDNIPVKKYQHQDILLSVATNGKHIAVTGSLNKILIFDLNLNLLQTVNSDTNPLGLEFSPNGQYLLSGFSYTYRAPSDVSIVYDSYDNYSIKTTFGAHDDLVRSVAFLNNGIAITAGGSTNDIYFWDIETSRVTGQINSSGQRIWSTGLDGKGIGWGNDLMSSINEKTRLKDFLNLNNLTSGVPKNIDSNLPVEWEEWSLSHRAMNGQISGALIIKKNDKEVATIIRDGTTGYRHLSYGFMHDGTIISSGSTGVISAYNLQGEQIAKFQGHSGGDVWSISTHKNYLLSGSGDQTIKLWNLDNIKANKFYINPVLSFFFDKYGEWVVWTESGYYAASKEGDKYIGFHINKGKGKASEFVTVSQLYDLLYRPDIIKLTWKLGSEELAISKAKQTRKTEKLNIAQRLPPKIILKNLSEQYIRTEGDNIDISFCVESQNNSPITRIDTILNGRIVGDRGIENNKKNEREQCFNKRIALISLEKDQVVEIIAHNKYSKSRPVSIKVKRNIKVHQDVYKPNLYILSVGVSKYKYDQYDLDFADKDAESIIQIFSKQKGIFRSVEHKMLLNKDATKDNILDALDWIEKETTQRDLSIIFIAGHGINSDRGDYYFLPHEANIKKLRRTGVNWHDFKDVVTNLPGKSLFFIDTCHSGNVMGGVSRSIDNNIISAIKSITSEGTGQVIMAAATGASVSIEDEKWGHGAFTKAIIEGVGGEADYDDNGIISIKELDLYVTTRVKKLTEGRQKPTTIIPRSVPNFAVGAI